MSEGQAAESQAAESQAAASEPASRRPRGREEVTEALVEAALALIAERGPGSVSLREIAERAGVNFGLVYQYLGTRDDVLRAVYQRVAAQSASRFESVAHLADAIELIMAIPDERQIGRMMGWAALEGAYPGDLLGRSPALEHVAELVERDADESGTPLQDEDARLFAAFLLVAALGWRLFRRVGLTSAGLDASSTDDYDERVTAWLQQLGAHIVFRSGE